METKAEYKTSTTYTDADLISDEHRSELIGLASADRLITFRAGDIAIEEIHSAASGGIAVSHDRIDEAIGRYLGKSGRTIRYYRETSAFFDQEVRARYDMLPFSFFVFARTMGDRWQEVLEYAALHPYFKLEGIKIAFLGLTVASSKSAVAANNSENKRSVESEPDEEETGYAVAPIERGEVSSGIPEQAVNHANLTVMNRFASALPEVAEIVSSSRINMTTKIAILSALKSLERLMPELLKHLV